MMLDSHLHLKNIGSYHTAVRENRTPIDGQDTRKLQNMCLPNRLRPVPLSGTENNTGTTRNEKYRFSKIFLAILQNGGV